VLQDGRKVTLEMVRVLLAEELRKVTAMPGAFGMKYDEAAWLLDRLVSNDEFADFLTEPAYEMVCARPLPQAIAA
jgi:malate synthase